MARQIDAARLAQEMTGGRMSRIGGTRYQLWPVKQCRECLDQGDAFKDST